MSEPTDRRGSADTPLRPRRKPAVPLPQARCPGAGDRCQATTKAGRPCTMSPGRGSVYCLMHDPERAEERRAELARRGRSGQAKRAARERRIREEVIAAVALSTAAEIRAALERALGSVEADRESGSVARAGAIARLCSVALDVIRGLDLEAQVAELRELVIEHVPGARERLGDHNRGRAPIQ